MFGYRVETRLAGQIRERWEAQKPWPFLTDNDLQSITKTATNAPRKSASAKATGL